MTCVTRGDHEWEPEYMEVEYDDHFYVYQPCAAVEITDSYTCDRLDEVFYEEGAECDAQRTITYDYSVYELTMHGSVELDMGVLYDMKPDLYASLLDRAADRLVEQMAHYAADVADPTPVEAEIDGDTFRVTFEHVSTDVR
jgi:hypothetical protein